jgi:hypothetical protein
LIINDAIESFKKEIINKMNDQEEDKFNHSKKLKENVKNE